MKVAIILTVYFVIGGLVTAYAATRAPAEARRGYWLKYIVYLLITTILVTVIAECPGVLPYIIALLGIGGMVEIMVALQSVYTKIRFDNRPIPFVPPRALLFPFTAGFVYFLCAALLLIFSSQAADNNLLFLYTYVLVVSFDGFSQIIGQVVKSRKLIPRISPGKTVAGFIGGVAATVVTGAILFSPEWTKGAGFGVLVAISAFTGDALASALKRRLGLKDFSNLIPGHGGILDRFDSMLMAGAVVEVVFYLSQSA